MENKLATLDRNLPLRAYPEQDLNKILLMDFLPWLASLLSLTDETSAERLEIALPAIKTACIGMGFLEIKKMFEYYVDHRLNIKPIPNYFDRILFGKIIDAYISQKPKKQVVVEEKEISKEEKENILKKGCERIFNQYIEKGEIKDKCDHIYDYLYSRNRLPTDELYKHAMFGKATLRAKSEAATNAGKSLELHRQLKKTLQAIDSGDKKSEIVSIAKRLVLEEYFSKTKTLNL